MNKKIKQIKRELGSSLLILAHHYQSDEIVQYADEVGDSLILAQAAAKNRQSKYIIFCGVHFMAETADILTTPEQLVYMPDVNAGCPMADMADLPQTEKAWKKLIDLFDDTIMPITYINSKAEIKSFCGEHGGTCVTSSNAKRVVSYGFEKKERILFLPDQNLGRNTAYSLGIPLEKMALYNPLKEEIEFDGKPEDIKIILWKGYCHAHHNILPETVKKVRSENKDIKIIVHPECTHETLELSDMNGSTQYIINAIKSSEPGTKWAIGTEKNLVERLKNTYTDKKIILLDEISQCKDMNLTNEKSLLSYLDDILNGKSERIVNVDEKIRENAKKALETMLKL